MVAEGAKLVKTDIELVAEVRQGHRGAFAELVERHKRPLLRLSLRFTRELALAEDIVQESFIKAFQKIHLFEGRASFKSWLYQIALNTARNSYRSRGLGAELSAGDAMDPTVLAAGVDPGAESEMLRADLRRLIRAEVDRLPERQRVALTLRVFEDLSFKEVAEIMDCPYDTAKANYRHAILKLKERVAELNLGDDDLVSSGDSSWELERKTIYTEAEV